MKEPHWLPKEAVFAMHAASLARFGGIDGIRKPRLLDSTLNKPKQLFHHDEPGLFALASAYASGIVKNHPFLDGNKRTGFLTAYTFLGINGLQLEATEEEAALQILALASSRLSDVALTDWLSGNCSSKPIKL
jgi:death-on-curing protein